MKVKIVKCSDKDWWHKKYINQIFEVTEWSYDAHFVPGVRPFGAILPKKDTIPV